MNYAMQRKITAGEAYDVSKCERNESGDYILNNFIEDVDYCDTKTEMWIWSVGQHNVTKEILASTSSKFYLNPDYECLFLR